MSGTAGGRLFSDKRYVFKAGRLILREPASTCRDPRRPRFRIGSALQDAGAAEEGRGDKARWEKGEAATDQDSLQSAIQSCNLQSGTCLRIGQARAALWGERRVRQLPTQRAAFIIDAGWGLVETVIYW